MTLLNPEDRASNRLLAHLPQEDKERLRQFLEPVVLEYKLPLYDADQRGELPSTTVLASLGCGNPTAVADLHEGEVVLMPDARPAWFTRPRKLANQLLVRRKQTDESTAS